MARPRAPPWQCTSTSTVGLPRLSSTSRARIRAIASGAATGHLLAIKRSELLVASIQHVWPGRGPLSQQGPAQAAHGLAFRFLGQVIHRTGAVDAREQTDAEVLGAAGLQLHERPEAHLTRVT